MKRGMSDEENLSSMPNHIGAILKASECFSAGPVIGQWQISGAHGSEKLCRKFIHALAAKVFCTFHVFLPSLFVFRLTRNIKRDRMALIFQEGGAGMAMNVFFYYFYYFAMGCPLSVVSDA